MRTNVGTAVGQAIQGTHLHNPAFGILQQQNHTYTQSHQTNPQINGNVAFTKFIHEHRRDINSFDVLHNTNLMPRLNNCLTCTTEEEEDQEMAEEVVQVGRGRGAGE